MRAKNFLKGVDLTNEDEVIKMMDAYKFSLDDEDIFELIKRGSISVEKILDILMNGADSEDIRLAGDYIRAYCWAKTKVKEEC